MKTLFIKTISGLVLTSSLVGLQGCTDEEVAAAVGIIAIGVGVGIIAEGSDGNSGGHYVCRGGYVTRCSTYTDYYGYPRHECREVWDSCAHREYRPYNHVELQASHRSLDMTIQSSDIASDIDPRQVLVDESFKASWAEEFSMGHSAADKLVAALEIAKNTGDAAALKELGLTENDLLRMAKFKMPAKGSIDTLAKNLDQSKDLTKQMLKRILKEAKNNRDLIEDVQQ